MLRARLSSLLLATVALVALLLSTSREADRLDAPREQAEAAEAIAPHPQAASDAASVPVVQAPTSDHAVDVQPKWGTLAPLAASSLQTAALPTTRLSGRSGVVEVLAGETRVQLRPGATIAHARRVARDTNTRLLAWDESRGSARLGHNDPDASPGDMARRAQRHPIVRWAGGHGVTRAAGDDGYILSLPGGDTWVWAEEKRQELFIGPATTEDKDDLPPVPLYALQWNLRDLHIAEAIRKGATGAGVVVAILDTGIAFESHTDDQHTYALAPDLAHVSFVPGYDFVNDDAHANDDHGHGTQMATLIAGMGATLAIAPNVTLMPVKVLDHDKMGTEQTLIDGIDWAVANGAQILSMSLAFSEGYVPSPMLRAAVDEAVAAGVLLIAASGNAGAVTTPYPAAFAGVTGVGATRLLYTEKDDKFPSDLAPYGNMSAGVDVVAPGGDASQDVDLNGVPDGVVSMSFPPGSPTEFGYWLMAGTSAATAQAAGVAALTVGVGDGPNTVRTRLFQTSRRFKDYDDFDCERAGGRIDAGEAVHKALDKPVKEACQEPVAYSNPVGMLRETPEGLSPRRSSS